LVATREAVAVSKPVEHEVKVFTSRDRPVIPVVFTESVADGTRSTLGGLDRAEHTVLGLMPASKLYIQDDSVNLTKGPTRFCSG
jgi:hypothetical protein